MQYRVFKIVAFIVDFGAINIFGETGCVSNVTGVLNMFYIV